jgi:hypothetical protein
MFCPKCGRDNSHERKYCGTCGTNLEAVSQVLSGNTDDFFTKLDIGLDQFIARYAEHVFKNAPSNAADRRVSKSWKVLGQGFLTSFVDMVLFSLMWNVLPLRLVILLISTPVRLLSERSSKHRTATAALEEQKQLSLPEAPARDWLVDSAPSVSEHTTERLREPLHPTRQQKSKAE